MTDVQAIKDAMATARQEIRDRVVRALRENGTATTSALREMFAEFTTKHRKGVFWNRLAELERAGVIKRAGALLDGREHREFPA